MIRVEQSCLSVVDGEASREQLRACGAVIDSSCMRGRELEAGASARTGPDVRPSRLLVHAGWPTLTIWLQGADAQPY